MPGLRLFGRTLDQLLDQKTQLRRWRQLALDQFAQIVHSQQPPMGLGQHGLVETTAVAEVIVDGGQIHARFGGDGLVGGFGVARRGE